jgi:hypothetical protein
MFAYYCSKYRCIQLFTYVYGNSLTYYDDFQIPFLFCFGRNEHIFDFFLVFKSRDKISNVINILCQ